MKEFLKKALKAKKFILGLGTPFILLPVALAIGTKEAKCAYVVLLMATYWLTEAIPLAVTALIPIVAFPILGILSTDDVCAQYMKETLMIFLGSLVAATAVEHCGLHQRIALRVLMIAGTSPPRLLVGFMLTTMFLSMWISNTAATALMVPIIDAVLLQLKSGQSSSPSTKEMECGIAMVEYPNNNATKANNFNEAGDENSKGSSKKEEDDRSSRMLKKALFLGICYSANIGGTGTLTGTPANLVLKGILDERYPDSHMISFVSWMEFNIPGMLLCIIIAWTFLYIAFVRKSKVKADDSVAKMIRQQYNNLGSITWHEILVLLLFIFLLNLWFFRDPEFMQGIEPAMHSEVSIKDATSTMLVVILFFLLPADPKNLTSSPALLNWKLIQEKVPWSTLLLLGGGFALAEGAKRSGLSHWLGDQLSALSSIPVIAMTLVLCLIALSFTEITSNTATATIFLPVIDDMAKSVNIHPLSVMLPVTICCSYAFMLPVASAPNAIVFDAAKLKPTEMALPGILMKLLCCGVTMLTIFTYGPVIFNMDLNNSTTVMTTQTFEPFTTLPTTLQ